MKKIWSFYKCQDLSEGFKHTLFLWSLNINKVGEDCILNCQINSVYKKLDFSICSEIILVKLLFYALQANESEYSSLSKVSSHFQLWAKPALE